MILTEIVAPTEEPLSLPEIKLHLRIDSTDEDLLLNSYAVAARIYAEMFARRAFVVQTLELALDGWPSCDHIVLPRPPLQSVTSVKYVDSDGNTQTMASGDYIVDTASEPGRVLLGYGKSWPSATLQPGPAIKVRYVAGYGGSVAVPQIYKQAMLLLIGHYYENREAVVAPEGGRLQEVPMAVQSLLLIDRGGFS